MKSILFFLFLFSSLTAELPFVDYGSLAYRDAELASDPEIRKKKFNEALHFYLDIASDSPSGQLLYDIANCYYQLGEYGLATLYYYRAQRQLPRERKIETNLEITKKKTGIEREEKKVFTMPSLKLSAYERSLVLFASLIACFIFFSFYLWAPHKIFSYFASLSSATALFFAVCLIWSSFFTPVDAVILNPTSLFQGPGTNYIKISSQPLLPGLCVRVVEVVSNGAWMRVELPSKERGYISAVEAQII